ncbi:MAG: hypothetical protein WAQ57_01360 [Candidatus Saccharimonadales bacterium]
MTINRPVSNIASATGRFLFGLLAVLIVFAAAAPIIHAADYPRPANRSLNIGDTTPGATTSYTFSWQLPSGGTVGSIRLLMCDNAFIDDPCVNPGGDMSAAALASQTGVTGFSILSQTTDVVLLSRSPSGAGTGQSAYVLNNVVNPVGLQERFFVRVQIYPSADGTGSYSYGGSVASATAEPIVISTEVPPILFFCAALTIDEWCQNVNGSFIDYGDLSPVVEDASISQFGVATNATGGYVVTINGNTMTAGTRSIAALATPTANTPGVPQFGLNLRANTSPANGQDPYGSGIGTVSSGYNTPDLYKFADGDMVASAVTGSLFNTYTVTYIVNVPPDQPSGVYNTTIAYICTAAF